MAPHALVLAAGLGTRMRSATAKVLHKIAGRPMILWVTELARALPCDRTVLVLGHQLEQVQAVVDARYPAPAGTAAPITVVRQEEQRGTGDAVRAGLAGLAGLPDDDVVLILSGDVPLLRRETLAALLAARGAAPLAVALMEPPDPRGYGRAITDAAGGLLRVVEERDAGAAERAVRLVNAGIYAARLGFLRAHVGGLRPENAQRELLLPDLVAVASAAAPVPTLVVPFEEVAGVNDRVDLARVDAAARRLVVERWMREGVTVRAPEGVLVDADGVSLGRDCELGPGVVLRGQTRLGERVRVDAGCVLTDTVVGDDTVLKPYSVLTETVVGARAQIGPFAHSRPGTVLEDDVHLGNFVETKKARLGKGAKANHLTYLGDAEVGARANVGAGTITCNYDGVAKHRTVIGEGAFIGSDTQLVAPVVVGAGAYVAAGATVTQEVPPGALAISRAPQVNVEGYVEKKRQKRLAAEKAKG